MKQEPDKWFRSTEIAKQVDISRNCITKNLRSMEENGEVERKRLLGSIVLWRLKREFVYEGKIKKVNPKSLKIKRFSSLEIKQLNLCSRKD